METEKTQRTVVHLEIDGRHYYFGSIAAIFTVFSKAQIGITYGSLRNYGLSVEKSYVNKICVIRKGVLTTIPKKN